MAPGKLHPNQTPKHERDRGSSSKYYQANKEDVQKRKLYQGLINGKRKNITQKTVTKYGLKFNDSGELIVPDEYKPKVRIEVEPQEPTRMVVKGRDQVVEEPKDIPRGPVTTHDVQTYIKTHYNDDLDNEGKKRLSASTIVQYATGAGVFLKLGFVKTYAEDIMPFVRDTQRTLSAINARQVTQATKNKDLHSVYFMAKHVPMIRDQVGKDTAQAYGKELGAGKKENTHAKYDELQAKKVYIWTDVIENVKKHFGKDSIEYLYFRMFEEVPIRTELANIKLVIDGDEIPKEGNYVFVRAGKNATVEVHLRAYKTHHSYGDKVYDKISKPLRQLIFASLKKEPRNVLFPIKAGRISNWLKDLLKEAGYPNFPYGPETTPADRDKITGGIRHTFASYANSSMNKGAFPKGHKLASLMLHELQQSLTAYQNKDFYTEADREEHMNKEQGEGSRKGGRRAGATTLTKKDKKGKKVVAIE